MGKIHRCSLDTVQFKPLLLAYNNMYLSTIFYFWMVTHAIICYSPLSPNKNDKKEFPANIF